MRWIVLIFNVFILSGCIPADINRNRSTDFISPAASNNVDSSQETSSRKVALPIYGAASELENQVWLNTDRPLRLADLRGKVVLLEMWTFG
jgi:hypothetical protein